MRYLVIDMVDGTQWKLDPKEDNVVSVPDWEPVRLGEVAAVLRAGGCIRFESEVEHRPPEGVEDWGWEGEPDCPATVHLFGRGVMQVIEVREPGDVRDARDVFNEAIATG